ncbi:MAG: hypothetical protein JL50_10960 [Peptococcaceae bacterium BICA1-7]|nr:MAG: hypothetical protein JL50_10960 [Peptococcaceae bacterium BICA1-7]HBV95806.1 sigma-70 family RNA polymerase sigma factor [Desulfotomaculum sp.]
MASGIEKSTLYRRSEEMLQNYRAMKARVAILENELASILGTNITETQDEAIEGMMFARVVNGMPMGSDVGDKTASVVSEWREKYRKDFSRVWRMYVLDKQGLEDELFTIRANIEKVDIAIASLLPKEKDVVTLFYIQGMKWEDVGRRLNYDPRQCQRIKERAVWYMSLSLFKRIVY